ncbi:TPA: hypothetical protein N0F65_012442 [Lagenidium giganteum]|uniref:Transposase n=1 Tax=Lagenidium giganteum TaxID=4803 RepID=A0AAV2YHC1_9STRA|nr:TPA: hypothetical protein N0F65_012442 [Lagenidium giganteum]
MEKVIPAVKAKWPLHQRHWRLKIQQDNASSHVDPYDMDVLHCAREGDLNVFDLGYCNRIQSLQTRTSPRTSSTKSTRHL